MSTLGANSQDARIERLTVLLIDAIVMRYPRDSESHLKIVRTLIESAVRAGIKRARRSAKEDPWK